MNQLVLHTPAPIVPALVAVAGERAGSRLLEFFRRRHPQPEHAPRLEPRGGRVPGLVGGPPACRRSRISRAARRDLDRGAHPELAAWSAKKQPRGGKWTLIDAPALASLDNTVLIDSEKRAS